MSPSSLTAPSSLCASLLPPSSSYSMNFARLISSLDNVPPSAPLALAFGAFADPVGFAGAAVAGHAAMRVPDELFTDEVDPSAGGAGGVGGLMGLLTGGAGGILGVGGGGAARPVAAAV